MKDILLWFLKPNKDISAVPLFFLLPVVFVKWSHFDCPKKFSSLLSNIGHQFSLEAFKAVYIQHKCFSLHFCLSTSFINAGLSVFIYCLRLFSLGLFSINYTYLMNFYFGLSLTYSPLHTSDSYFHIIGNKPFV